MTKTNYEDYKSNGFYLGELSRESKKPRYKRKANVTAPCDVKPKAYNEDRWYFIAPPKGVIIIDVDVKNGKKGMESLNALADDLYIDVDDLVPSVRTGSGGIHIYAKCSTIVKGIQKDYPDIDFQGHRSDSAKCPAYAVAGGQVIQYNDKPYSYEMLQESIVINTIDGLEDVLEKDVFIAVEVPDEGFMNLDDESDDGILKIEGKTYANKTVEEVEQLLIYWSAEDYDTWYKVCAVIKRELGDNEEAYEVFRSWSETASNYDEDECRKKWENIGETRGAVWSVSTLFKFARENKSKAYKIKLNEADKKTLKDVFDDGWGNYPIVEDDEFEPLAKAYQAKAKSFDMKVTIGEAREIVKVAPIRTKPSGWIDNIVMVESFSYGSKLFLLNTRERMSSDGINGRFSEELNELRKQWKMKTLTISNLVSMGMIKICSNHEYNPLTDSHVFKDPDGGLVLNTYRGGRRPAVADEYSVKGRGLVDNFVEHIKTIISDEEAKTLLDWMAWTAQNFGKKVLWTPLIQSAEGLGKSIIGNAMINHVFGRTNAGTVDSNVVVSPQTSWATNGVFRVLEEIKLAGHNRFEVLNQLKPFITNDTVSRVEKYEASSEVRNFTNFMAFTNFTDAIPVTADDRRWWVVFSKHPSIESLETATGMDRMDYFEPLHELTRADSEYGPEFHKFMIDRDVSDFNPSFPPKSLHKARMRATEDSKTPHLTELSELLERPSKGVTQDVVSTRQLKKLMLGDFWEGQTLTTGDLTSLLRKLGYIKFPKQIKANKQVHNVWFKRAGMDDGQVRSAFHESMKLEIEDGFEDLDLEDL